VDKAIRLAMYSVNLIAITFPTGSGASEAVGLRLIALNLSDPVTPLITIPVVHEGQATCLQVMHPVRTFSNPGLSFL
jgi:hypothetical protein